MRARRRRRTAGFTLIELMVVIIILGILGSVAALKLMSKTDDARQAKAVYDISEISKAVKLFYMDKNRLPESLEEIADQFENRELPRDPWGNDYLYEQKSKSDFDIICLGRDGEEGGEGYDQDINRKWKRNRQERE